MNCAQLNDRPIYFTILCRRMEIAFQTDLINHRNSSGSRFEHMFDLHYLLYAVLEKKYTKKFIMSLFNIIKKSKSIGKKTNIVKRKAMKIYQYFLNEIRG